MCYISGAFCGGCTDTQQHTVTGLAALLPKPKGITALDVADKESEEEDSAYED